MEIFRRLPSAPARALHRQTAHGFTSKDDRMDKMTHPVISRFNDKDIDLAQSLSDLQYSTVRVDEIPVNKYLRSKSSY